MSNWICLIEVMYDQGVRRTQLNLQDVQITDIASAKRAINDQLEEDGVDYSYHEKDNYYIVMLAKVNDD